MTNVQSVALLFGDRVLFERERANALYGTAAAWAATASVYAAFAALNGGLIAAAVAAACGLGDGADPGFKAAYAALTAAAAAAGFALCACLAAICRTAQAATMLFSLASFLAVALAGYLVRLPDLSAPLRAAANLSFPRWAYQAAVLHEFKGRDDLLGGPRYEAALLETYGFDEASLADCVLAQVALLAALLLLHLLALTRLNWDGR